MLKQKKGKKIKIAESVDGVKYKKNPREAGKRWKEKFRQDDEEKMVMDVVESLNENTEITDEHVDPSSYLGMSEGTLEPILNTQPEKQESVEVDLMDAEETEETEVEEIEESESKSKKIKKEKKILGTYSERPSFMDVPAVIIDRAEENKDVVEFQKTGDLKLLEKIYKNRIPTLKTWAKQHYYPGLAHSVEDLFEEFSFVFVKAAEKYEKKRGSFNTCLFSFLINRIKNIKNSKHAKKRLSEEYIGPISGMILSLDYTYNDSDGSEVTLKDMIASPETKDIGYISKKAFLDETLSILSSSSVNPNFKDFLIKVSEGGSLTSLIKEYKTQTGQIKISFAQAKKLSERKSKKFVKDIIKSKIDDSFKLVNYRIDEKVNLNYEIELKKTKETDSIMKTIRELRKNKEIYMGRIKGLK